MRESSSISESTDINQIREDLRNTNEELTRLRAQLADHLDLKTIIEKTTEELREKESILSGILETAADGIISIDSSGKIVAFNRAAEYMFGYKSEEVIDKNIKMLMPDEYAKYHDEYLARYVRTGDPKKIGHRRNLNGRKKNGDLFTFSLALSEFQSDGSHIFTGICTDISELNKKEKQLRKLSDAVEHTASIVLITDASANIEYVNRRFTEITGYTAEEVVGKRVSIIRSGEVSDDVYHSMWEQIMKGMIWRGEFHNRKKDGNTYWVLSTISPIITDGEITNFVAVQEEITERKEIEKRLAESESRLKVSQSFANIGTWDWNIQTNVLYWTERIAPLYGGPEKEMVTTYENFIQAIHSEDRNAVLEAINYSLNNGAQFNIEHRVIWPDGSIRWLLEQGDVIREKNGTPVRMLGVVQDVTQRKEDELNLIRAREEADRANKAKSDFLSSMSHELRTPLNAILGFAQLLQSSRKEPLTEKQDIYVGHIVKGGNHLLELINEVLDLARIEAGKTTFSFEKVEPARLVQDCMAFIGPMARKRNITIVDNMSGSELPSIFADYLRSKQILLNLLSNAVKYNREYGRITLTGRRIGDFFRFGVEDTGYGIPEDKHDELFEPFTRLGAENTEIEGTGVGLTLTKKLVEAMNGKIGFRSAAGQGSSFWIELPVAKVDLNENEMMTRNKSLKSEKIAPRVHKNSVKRILYVEDNPSNLELMSEIINEWEGLELVEVNNAEMALEIARNESIQLIIMDINLPGMNGDQAMRIIRDDSILKKIPVIALSANVVAHSADRIREAGFRYFLSKPLNINQLYNILDEILYDK